MTIPRDAIPHDPKFGKDMPEIALAPRLIDSPQLSHEERAERVSDVTNWTLHRLHEMDTAARDLVETKVQLFGKADGKFDPQEPIDTLLTDDIVENAAIIKASLDLRENATLGYNQLSRTYNNHPNDTPDERYAKESMRSAALRATKLLGFLPSKPQVSNDALGRWLDIQDHEHDVAPGRVDAAIVPGAAGTSNHSRLWNVLQSIESGDLETDTIIMATCYRPLRPDEIKKVSDAGLTYGYTPEEIAKKEAFFRKYDVYKVPYTEFDLCVGAAIDLLGAEFTSLGRAAAPEEHFNTGPKWAHSYRNRFEKAEVIFNGKPLTVYVHTSSYKNGFNAKNFPINRPGTVDAFKSAVTLLPPDTTRVSIHPHDAWIPYQEVVAKEVFDLGFGIESVTTGPRNATRLFYARDDNGEVSLNADGEPVVDILRAEEVIDEFAKVYQDTANLYKKAQAIRADAVDKAA